MASTEAQEGTSSARDTQMNKKLKIDNGSSKSESLVKGARLKEDYINRPVYLGSNRRVYLEAFSSFYHQARDFLVAIAEPISRMDLFHEYHITTYSIHGALAIGLDAHSILLTLGRLCKTPLKKEIVDFVQKVAEHFGNAKLVLKQGKYFIESTKVDILVSLLECPAICSARVRVMGLAENEFLVRKVMTTDKSDDLVNMLNVGRNVGSILDDDDDIDVDNDDQTAQSDRGSDMYAFEISSTGIEHVKREAQESGNPLLEEYEFYNCDLLKLNCCLKPTTSVRPYQEKALRKVFGNGRARSGSIVLPCGAGKTLVGVVAASTVRKSCIVLCTGVVAVQQWKNQFKLWTTLVDGDIMCFTSGQKGSMNLPQDRAFILITTYSMLGSSRRSDANEAIVQKIHNMEWGLMLLDEVHVVPANTFRRVVGGCRSHCKIGLTATLVREDDLIRDLEFLIGPKLFEANWLDLTKDGFLARVQCVEVGCPMTAEFFREYLRAKEMRKKRLLYVMNPNKFRACEYLRIKHEKLGDKIIIFADDVFALKWYADQLDIPLICGETKEQDRSRHFSSFKRSSIVNTIAVSKVGDIAIDIPEATVIIQISSHFGSRRQEAQRMGRILRPKVTNEGEEFNAHFYSLVSSDTQEMYYSSKRQQYLVDQGYSFSMRSNLPPPDFESMKLNTREQELVLLQSVLCSGAISAEEREDRDNENELDYEVEPETPFVQAARHISALTGADDDVYIEYSSK